VQPVHRPLPALFNNDRHRLNAFGDALPYDAFFSSRGPREHVIDASGGRLAHTQAKEIMVPRVDMAFLDTTKSIGDNVATAVENGYTRYPLCEGDTHAVLADRRVSP